MLSRIAPPLCALLLVSSTALARSNPTISSQARAFPPPPVRARAAVVLNAANGNVLEAKNPHLHLPMASTTKIMTALVALQLGKLTDRITVPRSAFDYEWDATVMGLHPGQVVTLHDLLYGLLLPSGADAANTIAIHYGGSEAGFVARMNQMAGMLGLHDTHYANAHGLTAANHYTSAYDLALLGRHISTIPELMKIVSTRSYRWNGHVLVNLNRVLTWYPGADGIKPGYTGDAGLCQLLDAQRGDRHVVVAILNTPDLVLDARNLLNYGLNDFSWVQSTLPNDRPSLLLGGTDSAGSYMYFPGSGHYVHGQFWSAYLANGGFNALGFPRTEPLWDGQARVQYFQNGALAAGAVGGVTRRAVGLTPLPTPLPTLTATPFPVPTATATPKPIEGTITASTGTSTATETPVTAAVPTPTPAARPRATATPHPPPGLLPTPTPTATPATGQVFAGFQRAHKDMLGQPVSLLSTRNGYAVQIFAYGALAYDQRTHTTYLLPLGDRLLAARHYLPTHPGNVYPTGFAPAAVLRAIGWPPYGS